MIPVYVLIISIAIAFLVGFSVWGLLAVSKEDELLKTERTHTVRKTIRAIKSQASRNRYICPISGQFRDNYTIRASDLEKIEEEITEGIL